MGVVRVWLKFCRIGPRRVRESLPQCCACYYGDWDAVQEEYLVRQGTVRVYPVIHVQYGHTCQPREVRGLG